MCLYRNQPKPAAVKRKYSHMARSKSKCDEEEDSWTPPQKRPITKRKQSLDDSGDTSTIANASSVATSCNVIEGTPQQKRGRPRKVAKQSSQANHQSCENKNATDDSM